MGLKRKIMKNFFIWVLVVIIFAVGYISIATSIMTENLSVWFIALVFSLLITCPAIDWGKEYFDNLFKK